MKMLWLSTALVALLSTAGASSDSSPGEVPLATTAEGPSKTSYKVLVLGPVGSRSLYHLTKSLSEALGDAGHSVTLVSTFEPSSTHPNITETPTGAPIEYLEGFNIFEFRETFSIFNWVMNVTTSVGRAMWQNENIWKLWERRREFDAIVIISYVNEIALPFLLDFEGTYVDLCTPGVELFTIARQGNWLSLSVTPTILLSFDEHMTFWERLVNPWVAWATYLLYRHTTQPAIRKVLEEFFPQMPSIPELYDSSHLTLVNGHFALDGPVPLLPTQVEIGTINARPPRPLPKDLEEFAESSGDDGILYFSLGSIAKARDIPLQNKLMFLEAFRRVPQKVIWKYEGDDLDLPPNVITRSWLPQQDILGHPKTRLFISHCGNLGTQEAKYHGVPVLAVPVSFDQYRNAARLARKGFGLVINWEDMTTESIVEAIETLLHNPAYAAKLKQVSEALKDQKESPKERAVWWVEYAIRHNLRNASHFEYAGRKLHFLQYVGADVIAFWAVALHLWIALCYFLCAGRCRRCRHGRKSKKKKMS
ncbi:UDP-glucosyltransferase 2-like [Macrobrachium rosenbergii]|uniref:UDP-glucosyltransferase 2-like n=1 Tax=Macrobrachium rosenbergii TaxID=79674 RepID=UPI0034D72793